MKTTRRRSLVLAAFLSWSVGALAANPFAKLPAAVSGGVPNLDLRLRYENVGQDNALEAADAVTARLRLGYTTGKWNQLDAMAEYEGVIYLFDEQYNSTRNGKTDLSVVGDPKGSELNQAWIRYSGIPGTTLKFGRSRLNLDNARFVGNVGWRQNEQTFDGTFLTNRLIPKTTLNYAFLTDVNNVAFAGFRLHGHLINVAYAPAPWLTLVAYDYLLDFEQNGPVRADTQTPGLRASGAVSAGPGKISYAVEYARQFDYQDAPDAVKASYYLAELGYGIPLVAGKLGYEVLGSNDGVYGFQTPLATLHAFQGWADQFLNTPNTGIRDAYTQLSGTVAKFSWLARYHRFKADEGGAHYGNELDVQSTYPINDALTVGAKFADYVADTFSVRTRKTWAWVEYKF
jgi:hypothetical protein